MLTHPPTATNLGQYQQAVEVRFPIPLWPTLMAYLQVRPRTHGCNTIVWI